MSDTMECQPLCSAHWEMLYSCRQRSWLSVGVQHNLEKLFLFFSHPKTWFHSVDSKCVHSYVVLSVQWKLKGMTSVIMAVKLCMKNVFGLWQIILLLVFILGNSLETTDTDIYIMVGTESVFRPYFLVCHYWQSKPMKLLYIGPART